MPKTLLLLLLAASASCFGQNAAVSINRGTGTPGTPFYPRVVAQVALKGQTGPIAQTTLLTPQTDGLYRISAYVATTVPSPPGTSNGGWGVILGWTDDAGAEQYTLPEAYCVGVPPGASGGGDRVVEDNAGMPLTFAVALDGFETGSTYELFLTVEQLQ